MRIKKLSLMYSIFINLSHMKTLFIFLVTLLGISTSIIAQNVGINSTGAAPVASAMLDIVATDKGLLVPRFALSDVTVAAPVVAPALSLIVYNTATAGVAPNNVLPGFYYWDGAKWVAFSGSGGREWALLGNAGTVAGTNFLGTTDNVDLQFRVNNIQGGKINIASNQTFFGYQAGLVTTGTGNSFFGTNSGIANAAGTFNTAVGYLTFTTSATGNFNTTIGYGSMRSNLSGSNNTFLGVNAGANWSATSNNTGVGMFALQGLPGGTGTGNTALGYGAGSGTTPNNLATGNGSYNTFIGYNASINNSAYTNATAVGANALAGASDVLILGGVNGTNGATSDVRVGVGVISPASSAILDITATDKGLLIPRVALTSIALAGPITAPVTSLIVYNTATAGAGTANAVTPGYYYWSGAAWIRLTGTGWQVGSSTATTNAIGAAGSIGYFGTSTSSHVDFVTNNLVRGRFSNLGEFFVGTINTVLAGDLMNAVGNVTFPWAANGYSAFDGAGVYGQITSGTTLYAGVQGEYYGTNAQGAGVRGLIGTNVAGTSFANTINGVNGAGGVTAASAGSYKFGVYGSGGVSIRSGGVMGYDFGINGALGYYASSGLDYSVYGFGTGYFTGVAAGRMANNSINNEIFNNPDSHIGLGIYGGVMGGWVKGLVYGTNFSGQKYGVYVHGNTITNDKFVQLNNSSSSDKRIASYATTALTNELTSKGKVNLVNGQATVSFDKKLTELCDLTSLVITATSMGNCNGVYIDNISKNGFTINEINNGTHNVAVSFIISGTLKQATEFTEADVLSNQYEVNMNGVMHNDNNTSTNGTPIWYDGQNVRHDAVDEELTGRKTLKEAQAKENEKLFRPTKKTTTEK